MNGYDDGKKCKDCSSFACDWCLNWGGNRKPEDECGIPKLINFSGRNDEKS